VAGRKGLPDEGRMASRLPRHQGTECAGHHSGWFLAAEVRPICLRRGHILLTGSLSCYALRAQLQLQRRELQTDHPVPGGPGEAEDCALKVCAQLLACARWHRDTVGRG